MPPNSRARGQVVGLAERFEDHVEEILGRDPDAAVRHLEDVIQSSCGSFSCRIRAGIAIRPVLRELRGVREEVEEDLPRPCAVDRLRPTGAPRGMSTISRCWSFPVDQRLHGPGDLVDASPTTSKGTRVRACPIRPASMLARSSTSLMSSRRC